MASPEYIDGHSGPIASSDRGLAYGDGLFETMIAVDGAIRWLDFHLDRLIAGCERLEIPAPARAELGRRLTARAPPVGHAVVKLIYTRGSGPRGYAPPARPSPVAIVFVDEVSATRQFAPVTADFLESRLAEHEKLAGIKHLCRIEQVLAQLELRRRRIEEGIVLNTSGNVIGCTSANVFAVRGSTVHTPRIRNSGIAGVMRRVVIEACRAAGVRVHEEDIVPDFLRTADELFLTNAVVGIREIAALEGRRLPSARMTARIREAVAAYAPA